MNGKGSLHRWTIKGAEWPPHLEKGGAEQVTVRINAFEESRFLGKGGPNSQSQLSKPERFPKPPSMVLSLNPEPTHFSTAF